MVTNKELSDRLKKISEKVDTLIALPTKRDESQLEKHYMISTSIVATLTGIVNLTIIFLMNLDKKLDLGFGSITELDLGLGLAAIGITTFVGITVSSSIFEEHRHDHNKKSKDHNEKSQNQFLQDTIVGKGIMRKALAASLVMTYIVLIGMSYSDGSIDNLWEKRIITNSTSMGTNGTHIYITDSANSTIMINSKNVSPDIDIKDIVRIDGKLKAISATAQATPSNSLVQHFTTIVSIVIGFYFGSNMVTAAINSKKKQLSAKEILDIRLAAGTIEDDDYTKKRDLIKDKSQSSKKTN